MARIMVVDDEQQVRVALRKFLEHSGHEVVEAADSEESITLFNEHPQDLVITDLFMPKKGGVEVVRQLKRTNPDLKIIVISAYGIRDELDLGSLAVQLGADCAFEKPMDLNELRKKIDELLSEAQ